MTSSIETVSQTELAQRRQRLRYRRRVRSLQTVWRVLAVSGLAAGLVWVATLPAWVIRRPDQVIIEGNRYLSSQTIRALLPIPYPQSLLRIEPQSIMRELTTKAPIAKVTVGRRLFPPSLIVQVQERFPVAIAVSLASNTPGTFPNPSKAQLVPLKAGLLDEAGVWIPLEVYTSLNQSLKLPELKVIGNLELYRPYWSKLYREVTQSPVRITEVNLQDPANVILKTELGIVHFGPYSAQFTYQLSTLDRMRKLSSDANFSQIAHIDLRNPDSPIVQMVKSKDLVKSSTP
ncbi:FtsQ-type POTRA domain-containing protein [Kovacikia minuta CCNUW1]|uniref:cell division protein FtsQ/DivIB n=1 Tax=Kovacikia minuta TaxID=2931930 RepID=UPI001CCDF09C|nr:FtsQ-type POTRA domain-containing protein [Kovacikia minuta]UBF24669.1 FtsQ-type POTRA domain-containing protein [Kovacikia minuta CCNUW1]